MYGLPYPPGAVSELETEQQLMKFGREEARVSHAPSIHPLVGAGVGLACILWGLLINGSLGGGLIGGGVGCILLALWDAFRLLYLTPQTQAHAEDSLTGRCKD
jgi:hypothetical protein